MITVRITRDGWCRMSPEDHARLFIHHAADLNGLLSNRVQDVTIRYLVNGTERRITV